jgi:hypothetical protein
MTRKCTICGTPAIDEKSVFCNQCGTRLLPDDVLICRKCGKMFTDLQSRFCNRCGSPLVPVAPAGSPAKPSGRAAAVKGTTCLTCGFENLAENAVYCKKCGAYLPRTEPAIKREAAAEVQRPVPLRGGIRIVPNGMDELRQGAVDERPAQPAVPKRKQQPVPPRPVYEPAAPQELPRKRRQEAPQEGAGYYRWLVFGAAGLLLVLVIAFLAMSVAGILGGSAANATSPGSGAENAPAPGLFESLFKGILPNQTPVSTEATSGIPKATTVSTTKKPVTGRTTPVLNQGTTVVTDTPVIL